MGPLLVAIYRRNTGTENSSDASGATGFNKKKRVKKHSSSPSELIVVPTIQEAADLAYHTVLGDPSSGLSLPSVGIVLDANYIAPILGEPEGLSGQFALALGKTAAPGQIIISYEAYREFCSAKLSDYLTKPLGRHVIMDDYPVCDVYQLSHSGGETEFPPLASKRPILHNLGTRMTSFFGRKTEIQEMIALLDDSRLVSIVGEPGMGKSSLAWRVGQELADDVVGGIWRVVCHDLSTKDDLLDELASALKKRFDSGQGAEETVTKWFDDHAGYVIIDRCDRAAEEAKDFITWLVGHCPSAKLIATHRFAFKVDGEVVYKLGPLPYPTHDGVASFDELMEFEGPRLFVDRVQQYHRSWTPNQDEIKAIIDLCKTVNGHPSTLVSFASEAASQNVIKVCEAVVSSARSDDQGSISLSMKPIDEAYRRLSDSARKCCSRMLAVYADCSVRDLAGLMQEDPEVAQTCLIELSNAGLIEMFFGEESEVRVHLNEPFGRYLRAKISPSERIEGEDAHLHYYVTVVSEIQKEWGQGNHQKVLTQIDPIYPDIRLAISRATTNRNVEGLTLYCLVGDYLFRTRPHQEGIELTRKVCSELIREPSSDAARAYLLLGVQYNLTQEYDQASEPLEQSFRIAQEIGDLTGIAKARGNLMITYRHIGNMVAARKAGEDSVKWFRQAGNKMNLAASLNNLGALLEDLKEYDAALGYFEEVNVVARELDDPWLICMSNGNIALLEYHLGLYEQALRSYWIQFEGSVKMGIIESLIITIEGISLCCAGLKRWSEAISFLATTDQMRNDHQITRTPDQDGEFERAFAPYVRTFGLDTFENQRSLATPLSNEEITSWFLINGYCVQ